LWIVGQVGLVAGVVSRARARAARRGELLDTIRLRYVVRGLIVLAACSLVTLALAAADVLDEITTSGAIGAPVALIGALTLSVGMITAAGVIAAWQAARRLAAIDQAPLSATGREPLIDLRDTLTDGLAWAAQRLPLSESLTRAILLPARWSVAARVLRRVGKRFDPSAHPWRYGALIALLAGTAISFLQLAVLMLKADLQAPHLAQLASAVLLMITIEATLVLAGYATIGRFLGLRRTHTPSPPQPRS